MDETLIKFKGRVQFRQFLPLKRSTLKLKGFVIADSSTGYVLNASIYTGKEGPAASKHLAMRVVMKLTEPYANKGYRLFVDNWYTSVPVFLELKRSGIIACETVRGNRKFLPKDIDDHRNEQVKKLKRGDSLFRQSNNLMCVTWKDKKIVRLLSTLPGSLDIGQVERRLRSEGQRQTQNFSQRKLIKLYDSSIRGFDLADQRIATCSRLMKGNIWYYKLFFYILEAAVFSVHIMYQGAAHPGVTLSDFKELLVEQPIGGNSFRRGSLSGNVALHVPVIRFNRQQSHYPVKTASHRNCKVHSGNSVLVFSLLSADVPSTLLRAISHFAGILF